jgi:hypothetical protein
MDEAAAAAADAIQVTRLSRCACFFIRAALLFIQDGEDEFPLGAADYALAQASQYPLAAFALTTSTTHR